MSGWRGGYQKSVALCASRFPQRLVGHTVIKTRKRANRQANEVP